MACFVTAGHLVIGAAFHILAVDNTGEFDPYFIERMKHALQLMKTKDFAAVIEAELAGERPQQYVRANREVKRDSDLGKKKTFDIFLV